MAHPKRQHSKQRSRKRRTHQKVRLASLVACSTCQKPVVPHRVCPFCGHYKGKVVVRIEQEVKETTDEKA